MEDNRAGLFKSSNTTFVKLIDGSVPDGSLKEKTELLGGQLTIDSGPGRGTRVTVDLPVGAVNSLR